MFTIGSGNEKKERWLYGVQTHMKQVEANPKELYPAAQVLGALAPVAVYCPAVVAIQELSVVAAYVPAAQLIEKK